MPSIVISRPRVIVRGPTLPAEATIASDARELERHPHARAVLAPALAPGGRASHAYLFHGPGGRRQAAAARAMAAELLAAGSPIRTSARARAPPAPIPI